jgi:hypothetical protein
MRRILALGVILTILSAKDVLAGFDVSELRLNNWAKVQAFIAGTADDKSAMARANKLSRRIANGKLEPVVLIVSSEETPCDEFADLEALPKGAALVRINVGGSVTAQQANNDKSNYFGFVSEPKKSDEYFSRHKSQPSDYEGTYIFGQRGDLVWVTTESGEGECGDAVLILRTLAAAANLRKRYAAAVAKHAGILAAPVVPVASIDDEPAPLARYVHAGTRALLVNVWAAWCKPCEMEMPELAKLQSEFKDVAEYVGLMTDTSDPGLLENMKRVAPSSLQSRQYGLMNSTQVVPLFPSQSGRHVADLHVPLTALISSSGKTLFSVTGSLAGDPTATRRLRESLSKLRRAK